MLEKIHIILKDKECWGNIICFLLSFIVVVYGLGFLYFGFAWLGNNTTNNLWQEVNGKIVKINKKSEKVDDKVELLRNMLASKYIQKKLMEK